MQQTKKYKLNLIEPSDPFLPDALNANTQRVEDVLIDKMEGSLDAMDQRVTVLEGHKFVYGTYEGPDLQGTSFIDLGFKPHAVLICEFSSTARLTLMTDNTKRTDLHGLSLTENGFKTTGYANSGYHFYIAFA